MTTEKAARLPQSSRNLAAKYGVDLEAVDATNSDGTLNTMDVLAAVRAKRQSVVDAAPQYVHAVAAAHGVDLSQITPEADDGKLTCLDLMAYGKQQGNQALENDALLAQLQWNAEGFSSSSASSYRPPGRPMGTVARYAVNRMPVNAMARNPLVDRVRAAASAQGAPSPAGSAPTLFVTGDTPAFCASGIPPQAVLTVPWQARHAMAAAPTAEAAYEIQNECGGSDAERTAQILFGNHPGNEDYQFRVDQWRLASMTDEQLQGSGEPGAPQEVARRERERTDTFNRSLVEEPTAPSARSGAQSEDDAMIDTLAARGTSVVLSNGRVPGQWSDPGRYR